jgi:hypothetical protein
MEHFERSLDPGLRMVTPSGAVLERDALLAHLDRTRGQRPPDHGISTRAERRVAAGQLVDGTPWVLMHYEEWVGSGAAQRGRQSSALLVADERALAGWRWLHVHETWLSPTEQSPTESPSTESPCAPTAKFTAKSSGGRPR